MKVVPQCSHGFDLEFKDLLGSTSPKDLFSCYGWTLSFVTLLNKEYIFSKNDLALNAKINHFYYFRYKLTKKVRGGISHQSAPYGICTCSVALM